MLLNILHTIAITTSLGVVLAQPKKDVQKNVQEKPQISKANSGEDYSINIDTNYSVYEYKEVDPNNPNKQINLYYGKNTYVDSTFSMEMISLNMETYTNSNNSQSYWLYQYGDTIRPNGKYTRVDEDNIYYEPYVQSLYLLKVIPNNVNIDTTYSLFQFIAMNNITNTNQRIYLDMIQTSTDINGYFNTPTGSNNPYFNKYTKKNNLYDEYVDIVYGTHGYQTTRIINNNVDILKTQFPINSGNWIVNPNFEQNIQITNNKTNYYIIYLQPYYYSDEENNMEQVESNIAATGTINNHQVFTYNNIEINGTEIIASTGTGEIVNIPGVMFTVLGMPFTFLSTAFNLTIFPGTAYEVNIGTMLLCVIAVLTFVFLIRIIIKAFGR